MTQEVDFLLIGGGLASTTTAETLRSEGAQGSIVMLAGEPVLPYHRPPLSKDYLLKDEGFDRLLIQPGAFYRDHNIDVRLGTRATGLDAQRKLVATDCAGAFLYRKLLIATGARVRDIPEVMARRDEIVYAERLNRDVRTRDLLDNYGKLVNELMSELDPTIAERVKQRPLYIETVGTTEPISVTRIVHTGEPGEGPSKDYEFSAETVEEHIEVGYIAACEALKTTGK